MSDPLSLKPNIDTSDYKAGISEMNRQIRILQSGFAATVAGMKDWDTTASGLEERNRTLTGVIDLQKQKVAALAAEYKKISDSQGAGSRAAEEMLIKMNKETAALNSNEAELKQNQQALEGARTGVKRLGDEEERTEKKTISLKQVMSGLGNVLKTAAKVIAGVATAAYAATAAIAGMVIKAAGAADELQETADKTGLTVEQLQELTYVGKQVGVETETVTGAMAKLIRSMDSAKGGTGAQAEAFKELEISVVGAGGKLRSNKDVFAEALVALGKIPDETERDAKAMALFGKSAQELNPLIKTSSAEIARLTQEAHDVGAVMSDQAVSGLAGFNDLLDSLKSGLQGTLGELAFAFLPGFKSFATELQGYLKQISSIVKGANGDTGKLAEGFGKMLGEMISGAAAKLPQVLNAGISILQQIINALLSNLPMLIPAVIQILTSLVNFIASNLPALMTAGIQILSMLVKSLLGMLPMLLTVAIEILLTLVNGITAELPTLIPVVVSILMEMVNVLLANLPLIITAAINLIIALVQGILNALPVLSSQVPVIVETIVDTLIENLPMLLVAAFQLIETLVFGIIENLPQLVMAVPQLINALVTKFRSPEMKGKFTEMGKELIAGLKSGWDSAWSSFSAAISKNFKAMVASIKKLLGIASPSTVFYDIMGNTGKGATLGWIDQFKVLKRIMTESMLSLTEGAAGSLGKLSINGNFQSAFQGAVPATSMPVPVTVNASVNSQIDVYRLAYQVSEIINRKK